MTDINDHSEPALDDTEPTPTGFVTEETLAVTEEEQPVQAANSGSSKKALGITAAVLGIAALIAVGVTAGSSNPSRTSSTATVPPTTAVKSPAEPLVQQTATTTKPEEVTVKVGADVTYGGLQFANTDTKNPIRITGVKPRVIGGDATQVNVADVVLVYPVPKEPTQLEKGWPPKAYPPENVFYAPGTFDLAPGEKTQILLRLAATTKAGVKIEGFDVTYTVAGKTVVAKVDNTLTLNN